MTRDEKHAYMVLAHETAVETIRLWGTGAIGPALVRRYYSPEGPWVRPAVLAESLHLSVPQVRRRLHELADAGQALRRDADGRHEFMAEPDRAERTFDAIWRLAGVSFCKDA